MKGIKWMLLSLLFSQGLLAQDKVFKAGASRLDVTPFLGAGIVGNYGTPPPAENIHDPLFVKALVLDDGSTRVAFVVVDNLGIYAHVAAKAKEKIAADVGIPVDRVVISATHTHSGPSTGGEGELRRGWNYDKPLDAYQQFMVHKIADAVGVAVHNLRPARIGAGKFLKPEHVFNRRWKMKTQMMSPLGFLDSAVMNPGHQNPNLLEPAGPTDPEISFLAVETTEGTPIAVFANYSLHYIGGVPKNDISADYYGVFAKKIEKLLHAENQAIPFVGIMSNGTSGDINNINFAEKAEKYPSYAKMELVADDIANSLAAAYRTVEFKDWVPLKAKSTQLKLRVRKADAALLQNMEKVKQHQPADPPLFHRLETTYLDRIIRHEAEFPDSITIVVQAFVVGDVGISTIPFEVFAETGLELKEKVPFKEVFTVGIANGYWGYLPTPRQHKMGGYETWLTSNKVQKNTTELIVSQLLDMFSELKGSK